MLPPDLNVIAGRLSVADAVLAAMLLAIPVALVLPGPVRLDRIRIPTALVVSYVLLAAWIAVEIVRNLDAYGLSALGQFRASYLVLVVPAFIMLTLRTATRRRAFVIVLIVFSIGAALCAVPVVGALRGWGIGESSRYLPASISMALLYGWAALFLLRERGALRLPRAAVIVLAVPVAAVVLADGHRSVWLAGLVLAAYFALRARLASRAFALAATLLAAVVALTMLSAVVFRLDVLSYVSARGAAFINPTADRTSSWRLDLWAANLARWRQHPIAGEGLGGYFSANALRNVPVTVGPHSLYVQTLVSLGLIGLVLLIGLIVWAALTLRQGRRQAESFDATSIDGALVEFGLGALLSAVAYWAVYPFDYSALLWVGLGLAATATMRRSQASTAADAMPEAGQRRKSAPNRTR